MDRGHSAPAAPLTAGTSGGGAASTGSRARRPWPIVVRRARPDDRDAVLRFASTTWDGTDYIPAAWDGWLAATDGVVLVATAGERPGGPPPTGADGSVLPPGHPIAMTRVAMLSEDEAWLEGIRVDPRVRGMGVATDLQAAELAWIAAHRARVVRYITGQDNEASHRLGAKDGIRLHSRWRSYGVQRDHDDAAEPAPSFARARSEIPLLDPGTAKERLDRWWERLSADPTFARGDGLYEYRPWAFQRLTRGRFEAHVRASEVVALDDASGWALGVLTARGVTSEQLGLQLSPLAGDPEAALRLIALIHAASGEPPRLRLPDPDPPLVAGRLDEFAGAGLEPYPRVAHLLERVIDPEAPAPRPDPERLVLADPPAPLARPRRSGEGAQIA